MFVFNFYLELKPKSSQTLPFSLLKISAGNPAGI